MIELTDNLQKDSDGLRLKFQLRAIPCVVFSKEKDKKLLEVEEMLRVLKKLVQDYF